MFMAHYSWGCIERGEAQMLLIIPGGNKQRRSITRLIQRAFIIPGH
jgi:hypothetical protein